MILGVIVACVGMPILVPRLPTDMARTSFILQSLKEPSPAPSICVFGSSVVMAGVDARRISESLPGEPVVWNLSSGGQALYEGFLFHQEVPPSVKVIVQCLNASHFEREPQVPRNKYNAFYMYGYRPDVSTREATKRYASRDVRQCMGQSDMQHRFEARWMVRSALDAAIRRMMRPDLDIRRMERDLVFPGPWNNNRKVPPKVLQRSLRIHCKPRPDPGFHVESRTTNFLLFANDTCRARGIRLLLVITPLRSEFREQFDESYRRQLDTYLNDLREQHDLLVIDCYNLVEDDLYVDHCHFNQTGAWVFSDFIASTLKSL